MIYTKKYPCGLRLVAKKMDGLFTVSFGVMVNVGSRNESPQENGYAHFLEHMLFKGTKRRTAVQINEEMDDIGATINAYTSKDVTCFYTRSVSEDLEKCVDLLSDLYFNSQFSEKEMEKEKAVVMEEINMCEDSPSDVSQDLIFKAAFHNQPLGQTILGLPHNIEYCDRHSIIKFKNSHYNAANTVISVAGNFCFEQLDELVQRYFADNFTGESVFVKVPKAKVTSEFAHKFKDIEQCHAELAFGCCGADSEQRCAVNVISVVLGGSTSSRMFRTKKKKKGLAYEVFSAPSFYSKVGLIEIYAAVAPDKYDAYCDALHTVLKDFVEKGITDRELARVKTQAEKGMLMGTESSLALMRLYGKKMLQQNVAFDIKKEAETYLALSKEQVNGLAAEIFSRKPASSYVGRQTDNFDAVSRLAL